MNDNPRLIPELKVSSFKKSLSFYINCGFNIDYERAEERFAMLNLNGAKLMIEEISGRSRNWIDWKMKYPFGRGINFQIEVNDANSLYTYLKEDNVPIYLDLEDKWYKVKEGELGNKQFIVQDPDGYMLRFFEDLGNR